ncbi:large-conductance mechanosensitive channel, partial [Globomyces pollinis-pini]
MFRGEYDYTEEKYAELNDFVEYGDRNLIIDSTSYDKFPKQFLEVDGVSKDHVDEQFEEEKHNPNEYEDYRQIAEGQYGSADGYRISAAQAAQEASRDAALVTKSYLDDFINFIGGGNVVDLTIGVIIGGAFSEIVASLVFDIFAPILSLIVGESLDNSFFLLKCPTDSDGHRTECLRSDYITLSNAHDAGAITLNYGSFFHTLFNFIIIAIIMYVLVRAYTSVFKKEVKEVNIEQESFFCDYCTSRIASKTIVCPYCNTNLKNPTDSSNETKSLEENKPTRNDSNGLVFVFGKSEENISESDQNKANENPDPFADQNIVKKNVETSRVENRNAELPPIKTYMSYTESANQPGMISTKTELPAENNEKISKDASTNEMANQTSSSSLSDIRKPNFLDGLTLIPLKKKTSLEPLKEL